MAQIRRAPRALNNSESEKGSVNLNDNQRERVGYGSGNATPHVGVCGRSGNSVVWGWTFQTVLWCQFDV